jgi:glycolate oxidase
MNIAFNEAELNLFKKIKQTFDPNGILNPGKMGI